MKLTDYTNASLSAGHDGEALHIAEIHAAVVAIE
jgi:hypothetical protein